MNKRHAAIWFAFFMTLGSGLINILSVITSRFPGRASRLGEVFPLEFLHISRFATLLIGFALIISSINIYKRKRRALQIVLLLAAFSVLFHLTKGLNYEEAALSLVLLVTLLLTRRQFTVKSSIPDLRLGIVRLAIALLVALGYGVLGFWLLEKHHFGMNFTLSDSVKKTFLALSLSNDPHLVPQTRYAHWFLDSLFLISGTALLYSVYAFFRPALFKFRTLPHERALAAEILDREGRSSLDYFKLWPDKSYFFTPSRKSFLAYGVANNFAIVLADPVGPEEEIGDIIGSFSGFCNEQDWKLVFHQTLPDFLPIYRALGFKKLKIGDDAIVDLAQFSLDGKRMKHIRHHINQLDKSGMKAEYCEPPISDDVFSKVEAVSKDWLLIPGRRERGFTEGLFERDYIRSTPLFVAQDQDGKIQAFFNIIPSYVKGEATIDLMRHRQDAPEGIMDYLFAKLFFLQKERGFTRFSLGMAPMAGFRETEEATREERAVHFFLQRLDFLFSYRGLFEYKKKFATIWEPRYVIYRNVSDLPRLALAINKVTALKKSKVDE